MPAEIGRVVALGASNLTRGFQTVVASSRAAWGPGVEVLAALGHGRSYGVPSQFLWRTLPAILDSGLWHELESRRPLATRGLVTDVGNDILYGFGAEQTLRWVDAALGRLRRVTDDIVVTSLPLAGIRRLSTGRFLLFRTVLVPSCRLSLAQVREAAERVDAGLAELCVAHGARLCRLDPAWYGLDPIHIRPSAWRPAWERILGCDPSVASGGSAFEQLALYRLPPERQWLFGRQRLRPQAGVALPAGGRVWLY